MGAGAVCGESPSGELLGRERSSRRVPEDEETIYWVDARRYILQRAQNTPRSLLETKVMGHPPGHILLLQGRKLPCRERHQG